MMQAMRERVKVVFWIIIVTFIGFTFLAWGIGDWSAPQQTASTTPVATVNGEDISAADWDRRTSSILSSLSAQRGGQSSLTESDRLRARDRAFDELVEEQIMMREVERRGLTVSDAEIEDILRNNPPPALLQQFGDIDAYYAALDDPGTDWSGVRNSLRLTVPQQKLIQMIGSGALVGETELREAWKEQNTRMVAEYVSLRFSEMELENDTVSEAEAQAYYDENLSEYKQAPRARVSIVQIPKTASEADEQEILSILEEIREDVVQGRLTFEEAARTYSEDTSADMGGDLGFFDRNRMTEPFTEAAFQLAVGDVSEPVKTQFGFHIIECTDERLNDAGEREEMRARHLLLRLAASTETVDALRESVADARDMAETAGMAAAAEELGVEIVETDPFLEGFIIPQVPNSLPGARFAFQSDAGALSPMFETDDGFYFFQVVERLPAGHQPLEQVRSLIETAILNQRRGDAAIAAMDEFLAGANADTDLAALVEGSEIFAHTVSDTFTLRQNVGNVGFATAFQRVALTMEPGEFRKGVRTQRGAYAIKLLYKSEFDEMEFETSRQRLAQQLMFTRQRILLQEWLDDRREEAEIVDRRADFLG